jgi:sucrose phosphorylase
LPFYKLGRDKAITSDDLKKVYTRKPRDPYTVIERADGSREKLWCTFDYEQIDLDWNSPKTREVMRQFILRLARRKIAMIRLDAFAYTTIKIGTDCFFLEPEIWELLSWLHDLAAAFDVQILPEVHKHYTYQLKLAEKGYWAYDFSLPMLVLHTLYHHHHRELVHWLNICPRKQITTLDTHDGIGVVDVADLMTPEQIDKTVNGLYEKGSNAKRIYSGPEYKNQDIYQINCTYFSALENNENSYLAARTIQFFTPGIPQVYYVGLLAGENDIERVEKTRQGRAINRHNYSLDEIEREAEKPVVKRLLELMRFRNEYPAFNGDFQIEDTPPDQLALTWRLAPFQATARIDLKDYQVEIQYYDKDKAGLRTYVV